MTHAQPNSMIPDSDLDRLALRAVRRIFEAVPWSEMSARMIGSNGSILDADATVGSLRAEIFSGARGDAITRDLVALCREARRRGLLAPRENPAASPVLEAWNRFSEGDDSAAEEGPVAILRGMMASEVTWAATPTRNRRGDEAPRHVDARINHMLFWARMEAAVPSLAQTMAAGTSADWHDGAREAIGRDGEVRPASARAVRRIRLAGWAPVLQQRSGKTLPWGPAIIPEPLRVAAAETDPSEDSEIDLPDLAT